MDQGALESPSPGLPPGATPSQLPVHVCCGASMKKARVSRVTPGFGCRARWWPGVTSAGDARAASSPDNRQNRLGIAVRLSDSTTRTSSSRFLDRRIAESARRGPPSYGLSPIDAGTRQKVHEFFVPAWPLCRAPKRRDCSRRRAPRRGACPGAASEPHFTGAVPNRNRDLIVRQFFRDRRPDSYDDLTRK